MRITGKRFILLRLSMPITHFPGFVFVSGNILEWIKRLVLQKSALLPLEGPSGVFAGAGEPPSDLAAARTP